MDKILNCGKHFYLLSVYFILALCVLSHASDQSDEDLNDVARGEVQSCRGCQLNRLPDVKTFVYTDLPKYSGVELHPIQGAPPQLVLFDKNDQELKRIDLSHLSRKECNELVSKWFKLKELDNTTKEERKEL